MRKYYKYLRHLLRIRHHHILLMSYPKAGSTWLRFIIYYATIDSSECNKIMMNSIMPELGVHMSGSSNWIKSHNRLFEKFFTKKVYLVRDPRNVALSYYRYNKIKGHISPKLTFSEFIRSSEYSFTSICSHFDNARGYYLLKYESLRKDPVGELQRLFQALNVEYCDDKIDNAVRLTNIDRMRKNESVTGTSESVKFFGKGKSEFSINEVDYLDLNYMNDIMQKHEIGRLYL
jgi:hypothetical protein